MHARPCVARQLRGAPPRIPQRRAVLDREAVAGEEKEEISGHSLPQRAETSTIHSSHALAFPLPHTTPASTSSSTFPPEFFALAQYSHPSDATPPHPRAESSSPPSRCRALVVPSASQNVVERVILRAASDAEPQGCDCFLRRDSRTVETSVSRATTTRPEATTATAAARCAWGDDVVIMKIGRARGSGLEANVRVEISLCSCAGLLMRFDFLSHVRRCTIRRNAATLCTPPPPPHSARPRQQWHPHLRTVLLLAVPARREEVGGS
ncbi:hypothetical protein C8R45DRAFT_1031779 [Mycena sanguinolenta]|nr:hypothetical protein C8R45DRAFT_1031779 [Mycena sanguinolenta]